MTQSNKTTVEIEKVWWWVYWLINVWFVFYWKLFGSKPSTEYASEHINIICNSKFMFEIKHLTIEY